MIFAYVSISSPGTSTKHFHCSSSPYFWLSVSSNILNTAIGHTHSLDTAVHGYGIRQSMISQLNMDLRRERKVWGWDWHSSAQGKYSMNTHLPGGQFSSPLWVPTSAWTWGDNVQSTVGVADRTLHVQTIMSMWLWQTTNINFISSYCYSQSITLQSPRNHSHIDTAHICMILYLHTYIPVFTPLIFLH